MSIQLIAFKRRQRLQCLAIVLAATMMIGCGRGMGNVSGRVTMDGKPLTSAVIYFQPTSGPLAQSPLDEEGKYRLLTPARDRVRRQAVIVSTWRKCLLKKRSWPNPVFSSRISWLAKRRQSPPFRRFRRKRVSTTRRLPPIGTAKSNPARTSLILK